MDKPDILLDVKGKVCPMPAAETRRIIRTLPPGNLLEVVGDCEEAAENVKNIALKNGGEVLASETAKNHFRVLIKKV